MVFLCLQKAMTRSKIIATGAYIPTETIPNSDFSSNVSSERDRSTLRSTPETVIQKFEAITGIAERRYAPQNTTASDMAFQAAKDAIANAGIDPESIDQIIVAHNYGDMKYLG